jgi:hypothetical protein
MKSMPLYTTASLYSSIPRGLINGLTPSIQTSVNILQIMSHISRLDNRRGGRNLVLLLSFFLALAFASPTLLAQDWDHWDHMNGRDKVHDPTGVWLWNTSIHEPDGQPALLIINFNAGGTLNADVQGAAAFDPSAVPLPPTDPNYNNNVITSPEHGVWQKTGWNTFAVTSLDIQYHVSTNPGPSSPVLQFAILQYSGKLTGSGDTMEITGQGTHYDPNGNPIGHPSPFKANGVRIPLSILPNTIQQLPIPQPPTEQP